ncbi:hypothetical protein NEOLEDRAFT_310465 [Neolentinus lepideus HHB14362 ss-1]|uniref:Uncharacterized protein n=1 Tax=Neolentinus lepideus HHB14362 ss-1 TaxID=1314782 RepID=A0A165VSG0_9AGAM|nr:hypothetical protein NEOLEDRAFT_310465 [Neolentinus lepideus HHB14362 ss-1]
MSLLSHRIIRNTSLVLLLGSSVYVYAENRRLTKAYPSRPATGAYHSSTLLATSEPSRYYPPSCTDIFIARIPKQALISAAQRLGLNDATSLNATGARIFLEAPIIGLESLVIGAAGDKGDTGELGFHTGQKLLNGIFRVEGPPSRTDPLVVSWKMPESMVEYFETLASAGYPCRLMSGGRHSIGVVEIPDSDEVELIFGCAHEYERYNRVNGKEDGKVIPAWVGWCHRIYGRRLLDDAVQQLVKSREEG